MLAKSVNVRIVSGLFLFLGEKPCICADIKEVMQKSLQHLIDQLDAIRSDFISPTATTFIVDTIKVNNRPLSHIANTSRTGNCIDVIPWDNSHLSDIQNALKLQGFKSYISSKKIVVTISGENSDKVKLRIKSLGEDAKISIRKIRQKNRKTSIKDDDKQIQKVTDEFIDKIEMLIKNKLKTL